MTDQQTFVPFAQSKTPEERRAYVDANPGKYKPRAEWLKENQDKIRLSIVEDILKRNNLK
jgi:hypothetical protein